MSHVSTRGSAVHVQTSLHLCLIVDSESPEAGNKFRVVTLKVWVVKVMIGPSVCAATVPLFKSSIGFPEAVQVELTDKAGEVLCFEAVCVVSGGADGGQDLGLAELLIDYDNLAPAVPVDGFSRRVVHQTPQFGREVVGIDGVREQIVTSIHAFYL